MKEANTNQAGDKNVPKKMNHSEYQAKVKKMSDAALRFAIKDAREAVAAMPYGEYGENGRWYADEINYCCAELYRRED